MRHPNELWNLVADEMFKNADDLFSGGSDIEAAIQAVDVTDEERAVLEAELVEQRQWEEYEAGNPFAEELKTHVPGVGFIVTNLGSGETAIFPDED